MATSDRSQPKSQNVFFRLDAALRRFGRALLRPSASGRVRLAAVFVLLLGLAGGVYASPAHTNGALAWAHETLHLPLWRVPSSGFRLGLDLQGGSHLLYEADVSQIPETERRDALEGVRDVIERRVNAFGVSEPLVQTSTAGGHYRVIVELAGIKDVNEAIKQIGETPILEFKEQSTEPARALTEQEKKDLATFNAGATKKAKDVAKQAVASVASSTAFAELAKQYSDDPGSKDTGGDLGYFATNTLVAEFSAAVEKLKDGEVTAEPVKTVFGYHIIKRTGERDTEKDGQKIHEYSASHILIRTKTEADIVPPEQWKGTGLTGKQLKRASVQFDQQSGEPNVALQFNDEGATLFAELTERNVGKPIAVFLDGAIISDPVVSQKIVGGQAVISGRAMTVASTKTLAQRLNAGALPVPVSLLSQKTVGATLGDASLAQSLFAGILGFIVVGLFMLVFYRFPGIIATVALLIYTALSLSLFKLFGFTMTLAGIAGFILSIGMAVDANILIFERMKEEIRRGRSVGAAVDEGFHRAWNSIRDSNFSSLITCAILYWFGTSVVRGFALTLALGIAVSLFSAITVTRTFLRLTMGSWAEKHLWLFGASRGKKEVVG
jgi:protein-export membrane protein SecD